MIQTSDTKIGIMLPYKDIKDGVFNSSYVTIDQVKTNLLNLLLTIKGERYMQPEFGTNLYKMIFEQNTEDLQESVIREITNSINTWLPYINIINIELYYQDESDFESNKLTVKLQYGLRNVQDFSDTITFRINNIV